MRILVDEFIYCENYEECMNYLRRTGGTKNHYNGPILSLKDIRNWIRKNDWKITREDKCYCPECTKKAKNKK